GTEPGAAKPPIVPLFVAGFIVAMLIRTAGFLPEGFLGAMEIAQTILLAAAMFGLGLGVHIRSLFKVGAKPVVLGVISTAIILVVSMEGSLLFGLTRVHTLIKAYVLFIHYVLCLVDYIQLG